LRHDEVEFYRLVEGFNNSAQATQIVLVNQFGWNRERCGERMPEDMTDDDIRWGSDLEFGQSIYEPFGISQIEPLGYGALCVVSSVCGCLGFIRQVAKGQLPENLIVADYVTLPEGAADGDYRASQELGLAKRNHIEVAQAQQVAQEIMDRLPTTKRARQRLLKQGYQSVQQMSWDIVVQHYLLPALVRAASV
jgi:glycogen synthase